MTAKEWRDSNKDKQGNIRDYATLEQLITLTNLESNNYSLKITGIANNPKHLQSFYNLLKSQKKFNLVEFQTIKKLDAGYGFTIALNKYAKN